MRSCGRDGGIGGGLLPWWRIKERFEDAGWLCGKELGYGRTMGYDAGLIEPYWDPWPKFELKGSAKSKSEVNELAIASRLKN